MTHDTIYFNEVYIPAQRVYSLNFFLVVLLCSSWQYTNSFWSRAGFQFIYWKIW